MGWGWDEATQSLVDDGLGNVNNPESGGASSDLYGSGGGQYSADGKWAVDGNGAYIDLGGGSVYVGPGDPSDPNNSAAVNNTDNYMAPGEYTKFSGDPSTWDTIASASTGAYNWMAKKLGTTADYIKTAVTSPSGLSWLKGALPAAIGVAGTVMAADSAAAATKYGIDEQRRQFDKTQGNLKPYMDAGKAALTGMQSTYDQNIPELATTEQDLPQLNGDLGQNSLTDAGWKQADIKGFTSTAGPIKTAADQNQLGAAGDMRTSANQSLLGEGPQLTNNAGQQGVKLDSFNYDPNNYYNSPVYQALLQSGVEANDASAAAKGSFGSGNQKAELQKLGMQVGAQYMGQDYQQQMGQFSANQGAQTQQANINNQAVLTNNQFYNQALQQGYSNEQAQQMANNQANLQNQQFYNQGTQANFNNLAAQNQANNAANLGNAQFQNQAQNQLYGQQQQDWQANNTQQTQQYGYDTQRTIGLNESQNATGASNIQYQNQVNQQNYGNENDLQTQLYNAKMAGNMLEYNRLAGLAGIGQNTTNTLASAGGSAANAISNLAQKGGAAQANLINQGATQVASYFTGA